MFSPCTCVGMLIMWFKWNPKGDTWIITGWFLTEITLFQQQHKCAVWEKFHNLCTLRNSVDNSLERDVESYARRSKIFEEVATGGGEAGGREESNQNPFMGEAWMFSGTAQYRFILKLSPVRYFNNEIFWLHVKTLKFCVTDFTIIYQQ